MRRLLCKLFGHHRDARRARPSFDGWRSSCMLCGARMVRLSPGRWSLAEDVRRPAQTKAAGDRLRWPRLNRSRRRSDHADEVDRARRVIRDLFD